MDTSFKMKSAAEWLNEVGETAMGAAFNFQGGHAPGTELENLIREIQVDVLKHALFIANDYHLPRNIRDVLRDEIEKLTP